MNTQVHDPLAVIDAVAAHTFSRPRCPPRTRTASTASPWTSSNSGVKPAAAPEPLLRLRPEARTHDECDHTPSELLHLITKG